MEKTKFCTNCGAIIPESAKFCSSCGKDQYASNPINSNFQNSDQHYKKSFNEDWIITLLLCWFLGVFGAHRFYNRRFISGFFMLISLGGFFIWYFIDLILVIAGNFKDENGHRIPVKI
ncbi:MAG: hypothetical protein RIR51_259 [Bacteroidota bacterium]|jgi:hypothetical protein